jgi:hypothetical protein
MRKKLNVDLIQSELRGGSAFFPGYKSDQSPTSAPEKRSEKPPKVTPRKKTVPAVKEMDSNGVPPGDPHGVLEGIPEGGTPSSPPYTEKAKKADQATPAL